jgi:DNA-binding MarR family transcriptional regulator
VERHAADRRSNGLFLTRDGTSLLRRLKRKVAQHERRVVHDLSARERNQLVALLQRILPEKR